MQSEILNQVWFPFTIRRLPLISFMKHMNMKRSPSGEMDGGEMCDHILYHDTQIIYAWPQDDCHHFHTDCSLSHCWIAHFNYDKFE